MNCLKCKKLHNNKKFCSNKCKYEYFKEHQIGAFYNSKIQSELGKRVSFETHSKAGKRSQITLKKLKKGFYNPRNSIKANEIQRIRKTGRFNSKLQSKWGKLGARATHKVCRKNKTGFWQEDNPLRKIWGKMSAEVNRKNKTGFYDPKIQSMGGKIGGVIAAKILRDKKGYIFNNINFDSKSEMEIGMCIHYQIEKLEEGKNYQVRIDRILIDFFVKGIFIEYHPLNLLYDTKEKYKLWKIRRRKILNENGYTDYPLMIIK